MCQEVDGFSGVPGYSTQEVRGHSSLLNGERLESG